MNISTHTVTDNRTLQELQNLAAALIANPSPSHVTQEMLEVYNALGSMNSLRNNIRRHLLQLLDAGVPVEPGTLATWFEETVSRRFSFRLMVDLLGQQEAEALRDRLPLSTSRKLMVSDSPDELDGNISPWWL